MPDAYPVQVDVQYPERPLNRLATAFRVFTIIPIAIVLGSVSGETWSWSTSGTTRTVVAGAGGTLFFGPLLMILFREKYPRWWFDWNPRAHALLLACRALRRVARRSLPIDRRTARDQCSPFGAFGAAASDRPRTGGRCSVEDPGRAGWSSAAGAWPRAQRRYARSMALSTGLVRPRRGRIIAGVCAALARPVDAKPWQVRLIFLLSCLLPGPGFLLYIALWIILPSE